MPVQWNRKNTEEFIGLLQQHECLWNVHHICYQDRKEREKAFKAMLSSLKENVVTLTLPELKCKVQSLRGQYRKELRAIKASQRSGVGSDEVRTPRLWCFYMLDFLRPSIEIRTSTSNIEVDLSVLEHEEKIMDFTQDTVEPISAPSITKQAQRQRSRKPPDAINKELSDLVKILERKVERKYEWLGEQIVQTLNEMSNQNLIDETILNIQKQILEIQSYGVEDENK